MNYAKFANTYKNGKIISKKDKYGRTRAYTIEEVEQLIDELSNDKDENGKVKDPESLNNAVKVLMQLYRKYGNPHEKDIIEAIKKAQEEKPLEEQKEEALNDVLNEITTDTSAVEATINDVKRMEKEYADHEDEYVDFEEIKEDGE